MTKEGSFNEFLGIKMETRKNGSINMTQKGLIEKIIEITKMQDCNPNYTPGAPKPVGQAPDDEPWDNSI